MKNKQIEKILLQILEMDKCYNEMLKYIEKQKIKVDEDDKKAYTITIASFLGSIYNGLEECFIIILNEHNKTIEQNEHYHKTIINNMKEIGFLNNEIYEKTDNYRAYRHLWRHNYTHRLKESEISVLAADVKHIYNVIRKLILSFLNDIIDIKQFDNLLDDCKNLLSQYIS